MKNIVVSLMMTAAVMGLAGQAAAAEFAPVEGRLYSKTFGDVKIHDYVTRSGGAAQVVETDRLVVLDVPGNAAQNEDFRNFVRSLDKPVEAVILSHRDAHHWIGADVLFPGVKMYSPDAEAIRDGGAKALADARKSMGEEAVPYDTVPAVEKLENGARSFAGVEYVVTALPDLGAVIIRLPAQKTAMIHHLGYVGVHVPMAPFSQRLAQIRTLEKTGYSWIVAGHGFPGDSETFTQNVADYYAFVADAVKNSSSVEEARALIIKRYPDYQSAFLLDLLLPGLMGK